MKTIMRTVAIMLCLLTSISAVAENSLSALRDQMRHMVSELGSSDRDKIKVFIRTFATPADLEELMEDETLDQLTSDFMGDNQDYLKRHLEAALNLQPVITGDGIIYTFDQALDASERMERDLVMVYSAEKQRFYLNN